MSFVCQPNTGPNPYSSIPRILWERRRVVVSVDFGLWNGINEPVGRNGNFGGLERTNGGARANEVKPAVVLQRQFEPPFGNDGVAKGRLRGYLVGRIDWYTRPAPYLI